ncbi:MAG TPA: hypothetical protein VGJ38_00585 [Jatrophihabitantaceae bacterium]|jgi:predicted transcriptional regulator
MATNLRLRPDAEIALRAEAERTGRSQQDILRDALDRHLGLHTAESAGSNDREAAIASGVVRPPRTPYRRVQPAIRLRRGTSLELLGREDRI